ncbi:MAG TPA: hypothetical protein VOA87_08235 [Thermoanaerobaculia bacterium]|nr:hypothetical protein [Thermoanaerobaculia bacterium]
MAASVAALLPAAAHAAGPFQYFAVTPCRVVDTRNPPATNGGPALTANTTRSFKVQGNCGVPVGATAVTVNVTIVSPSLSTSGGFMTLFPSGGGIPTVSTINFTNSDSALANGAIVPVSTNANDLSVFFNAYNLGSGTVHLVLDVTGYFM